MPETGDAVLTRLVLSPAAFQDIDRPADFLLESDPVAAGDTTAPLISGLRIPQQHPLIGRQVERGCRELVISRGDTGYVALYKFDVKNDHAIVLSIRHQREAGSPFTIYDSPITHYHSPIPPHPRS